MTIRVSATSLIPGSVVVGNPGLGVLASQVPATGQHGAGFVFGDLNLPADSSLEVRGVIVGRPAQGKFFAYEDTSFSFEAAPGTYSFEYQLYANGAPVGAPQTVTLTIEAG